MYSLETEYQSVCQGKPTLMIPKKGCSPLKGAAICICSWKQEHDFAALDFSGSPLAQDK